MCEVLFSQVKQAKTFHGLEMSDFQVANNSDWNLCIIC